jgi:hypothetical protein
MRMRNLFIVMAIVLFSAIPMFASVTFNPDNGAGFVGKGDVQTSFGWNNGQVQRNAGGVGFSYIVNQHYVAVCEWFTGPTFNRKQHDVEHKRSINVNDIVGYDPRTHKQIDGFILTGFGSINEGGQDVPVVGSACVNSDDGTAHNGTWVSVDLISSTGGFFVIYNGNNVQLFPSAP